MECHDHCSGALAILTCASTMPTGDVPLRGIPGAFARPVDTLPEDAPGKTGVLQHRPNGLFFEVPSVARYRISGGNLIEFAPAPEADPRAVELFLHNSARGYLVHQRGELPLAAATLLSPRLKGVAICGPSAFGKSTLAAALCRRGWKLVADGITRVTGNGITATAWPADAHLGLWKDACKRLRVNLDRAVMVRGELLKFFVPVPSAEAPLALTAIIGLRMIPGARLAAVLPSDRSAMISEMSFRHQQIAALGFAAGHARAVTAVAAGCRCFWLDGARRADVQALADLVESATQ